MLLILILAAICSRSVVMETCPTEASFQEIAWGRWHSDRECFSTEPHECSAGQPRAQIGLPRSRMELETQCETYNTSMSCLVEWMERCLPEVSQRLDPRQIEGDRTLMRYLCNNSSLKREFLRESSCWTDISDDMNTCVQRLQAAVREVAKRMQLQHYVYTQNDLCCAHEEFKLCAENAARARCVTSAVILLRRLARLLAADVGPCAAGARAFCAAPPPPRLARAPLALLPPLAMLLRALRL